MDDIIEELKESTRDIDLDALQVLVMSSNYIYLIFKHSMVSNQNCFYLRICSDEASPKFWEEVSQKGWLHINHTTERTLERFGEWYPPLIDIVTQSYAVGFVGTEDSTFSLLGQRRVEYWNGGIARTVDLRKGF